MEFESRTAVRRQHLTHVTKAGRLWSDDQFAFTVLHLKEVAAKTGRKVTAKTAHRRLSARLSSTEAGPVQKFIVTRVAVTGLYISLCTCACAVSVDILKGTNDGTTDHCGAVSVDILRGTNDRTTDHCCAVSVDILRGTNDRTTDHCCAVSVDILRGTNDRTTDHCCAVSVDILKGTNDRTTDHCCAVSVDILRGGLTTGPLITAVL